MAKQKTEDLRALSTGELETKKEALVKELFELRQKKLVGQLDKPHQFKKARRQIAQINTFQREQKKNVNTSAKK